MKPDKIYTIETREEEKSLVMEFGAEGKNAVFRFNSTAKPTVEAERFAKQFEMLPIKRIAVLFGLGSGIFAKKLLERLSDESLLIIYEPCSAVTDYVKEHFDIAGLLGDERVVLCVEENDRLAFKESLISNVDYYRLESMIVAVHPRYDEAFAESYGRFIGYLNENRERILVNKNTLARFKNTASANVITNLHVLREINLTEELGKILPKDVPVIIVSAGPSLDKNVWLLRELKGHCLILAVDTAVKSLLERDILPDITITVDAEKPKEHYADIRSLEIPIIMDGESNPEIIGKHTGRKILYNCRDYMKRLLESIGKEVPCDVASGGSVATAAFAICYQLEMKTIILIGQDLAYSGETTHAGGVESKGINNDIGYTMVEDIYGGEVRTRSDWTGYLKWFENAITVIKDMKKDISVIDATEGGAKIHGSSIMTLREAADRFCNCDYDFSKELKGLSYLLNEQEYNKLTEAAERADRELLAVRERAEGASKLCDELICRADAQGAVKGVKTEFERLASDRKFCEAALMYPLINNYAVSDIAEEVGRLYSMPDAGTEANKLRQLRLAFDAIVKACDYFGHGGRE